ncbi:hypothetical protein J437_LFUL000481 [Ladona fulva]|uniref:isoleucine--tRNA ligase n=1 Tax=Ladona fulva TaxID=123851 RepID=A0A8K0P8N9_LADFU|nr:hypothetical protein J437_LFUL000481 [Ladona fulva]
MYRDLKPVFWSPSSRTALAEAELEYDESYLSTAVTVKMKISSVPEPLSAMLPKSKADLYALVWTTTPWTLPSNRAICFSPKLEYVITKLNNSDDSLYLLGKDVFQEVGAKMGLQFEVVTSFPGHLLQGMRYTKLFSEFEEKASDMPFLPGNHVTGEKGTGLVHTAPAHGPDDFVVALDNGLPLDCYVNEEGQFTSELEYLGLRGLDVLSKETTQKVTSLLGANLLHAAPFKHSYPCDWRTKQPVILRASQQWFIDTHKLKDLALECLSNIEIIPGKSGEKKSSILATMLQRRPYWCISRQRAWGVPLPVLYHKETGEALITKDFVAHLSSCIDKHGPDYWWSLPVEEIASEDILKKYSTDDLEKGKDIMDIWFDSGVSWFSVLNGNGNAKVADLYLEGVDQFSGWFQSSLMTSCAIQGSAPYRYEF